VYSFSRVLTFALGATLMVPLVANLNSASSNEVLAAGTCGLSTPAFCETFDASSPARGDRAGGLNGVLWGVSRSTSDTNFGAQILNKWSSSQLQACGTTRLVAPENDAVICNGRMAESINDNENTNIWAAYPRQPFDIAGRTGKATFDVGNDTQGPHAAWPAFIYTDQPVPAPYGGIAAPGVSNYPRNSIGFSLANGPCVDDVFMTTNYVSTTVPFTQDGCIQPASAAQIAAGQLNHYEVDLTSSSMTVFGTDPGSSTLKQIAHVSGIKVPLSRGLVWIEDVHYNGGKFNNQRNHTFVWDNVGFDGPVLARDLGFDVLDARASKGNGLDGYPAMNLGYMVQGSNPGLTVQTVPDMTSAQIGAASGALLEFNWFPYNQQSLTYSLNGHTSHNVAWPYPGNYTFSSQTLAVPIALSELQAGVNSIHLQTSDSQVMMANFDIILVGAGGTAGGAIGGGANPTATRTPTAQATQVPVSTATQTSTPVRAATQTATPTRTPVPPTPPAQGTTPAFLQANFSKIVSGQSVGVAFPQVSKAGNTIVAYVLWSETTSASLSDSQGNLYSSVAAPTRWNGNVWSAQTLYSSNIKGGTNTVTAKFSSSIRTFGILYIHEYSGLAPTNPVAASSAAAGTSAALNSGFINATHSKSLLFSAGGSANTVTAVGTGYSVRSAGLGNITADKNVSTPGQYSASGNQDGSAWVLQIVALNAANSTP
jgi:hypothetical protein